MKHRFLFSIFSLALGALAYTQTTHVVENVGFTFSPSSLTIQEGDEVEFDIGGSHNVNEFSEEDFNSQTQNPLPGGFQLDNGGGLVTSEFLTVGTHYYYCAPHFSLDMFGIIIVEPSQGCEGDFDGDLDVDVADFLSLNSAFGTTCSDCPEDITGDGMVDINDFIQFNSAFGSPCE